VARPVTPELAAWYEKAQRTVDLVSLPGHDRDCALAMLSQARLCEEQAPHTPHRISQTQAEHLLAIGERAGHQNGRRAAAEEILARARQLQAEADATGDTDPLGQLTDEIEGLWTAARIADLGRWQVARDNALAEQAGSTP
jgi:hypothetical protein